MVRPDSLYAKVLKGKCYPHGDFISATKKKKSSETWRAILWGREALEKGLIKRIGPGDSVNIWTDQWIGGLRSMKPLVRLVEVRMEQVHELFLPGTRTWNEQLIRSSFIPHDAEEILKVRPAPDCKKTHMPGLMSGVGGTRSVRATGGSRRSKIRRR
jgi:hypothetical protein